MAERQSSNAATGNRNVEDEIMELLPLNISGADAERHPAFMKLLKGLSRHITDKGLSVSAQQDITEAQECVRVCKGKWLQSHIPYLELQDLLMDQQLGLTQATPGSNTQFYKTARECLALAEIGDCLQCSPDPRSEATLLGVTQEDINRHHPHKKHMASIQQKLIPELETRLRRKCERLLTFHNTTDTDTDSLNHTFVKCTQLPGILEAEKRSIAEQRRLLRKDRALREKYLWQYYKTLTEALTALETLITTHRLHSQSDNDTITSEWLCARCDALYLKVNQMELQLLCDSYHAETVQALMVIRREMDGATKNTQEEWTKASEALKTYESVGMGFDGLVQEYTHLQDEIANKKWALRELK